MEDDEVLGAQKCLKVSHSVTLGGLSFCRTVKRVLEKRENYERSKLRQLPRSPSTLSFEVLASFPRLFVFARSDGMANSQPGIVVCRGHVF